MRQINQFLNMDDNNAVIMALKAGSEAAFDTVYRHYFRGLCAFCSQYVTQSEAEEIVQDTMMWLWENRLNLIKDLTLKTLLFTIVKNKALNKLSHHEVRRKVHQEIIDKYTEEFSSPDFYLKNELLSLYEQALRKLPPEFREAYEMNRYHQMTHKEIAEKLKVSPQTINYRIGQTLKLLRIALKDYLPFLILLP